MPNHLEKTSLSSSGSLAESNQSATTTLSPKTQPNAVPGAGGVNDSGTGADNNTTTPVTSPAVPGNSQKEGGLFYMLLMGFKAKSESEAISLFQMLKKAASSDSNGSLTVTELAQST